MPNLLYIGNKLSKHGSTVTGIEVLGKLLQNDGFRVRYASEKKNQFARLIDMIVATIASRNADYVLIDTYSTKNFWYAIAVSQLCRIFNVKYIPILHGGNLPARLEKNPLLSSMVFKNAYCNVAPSDYLKSAFERAGFSNVKRIANPFHSSEFPYLERKAFGPKLLWVRSIASIYNPEMALDVLDLLVKDFPDASLCMVGPGSDGLLEKLKQKAASRKLDVRFVGRLSKQQWAVLSAEYDIFLNTSQTDNAPFSLIEASSLGMAIVSTNVGGIPYLFEHRKNAMLVSSGDAPAMANAIGEVLKNQTLAKGLVQQSRRLAQDSRVESVMKQWRGILI